MLIEPRQGPLGRGARHRPRIHHHESDKCGPQRGRNLVRVKRAGDEHKFGPGGGAVGESNLAFVSTEEHHDVGGDEVGGTEQTHETVCGVRELTSLDQGLNEEGSRGALVAAWVGGGTASRGEDLRGRSVGCGTWWRSGWLVSSRRSMKVGWIENQVPSQINIAFSKDPDMNWCSAMAKRSRKR